MTGFGCLFVFLLMVVITIIVAVMNILRALLGFIPGSKINKQKKAQSGRTTYTQSGTRTESQQQSSNTANKKTKVFEDSEGEYVDFEEIKD